MEQVLYEFPVKDMTVRIPKWVQMLSTSHWLRTEVDADIRKAVSLVKRVRDIDACVMMLHASQHIAKVTVDKVDMATGTATLDLDVGEDSFLKVMGEKAGTTVSDKADLLNLVG